MVGITEGQVSNNSKALKRGLSTGEVRVNSLSSTWMGAEHVKTQLWRCRLSGG
jgi:hypothetical protein